MTDKSNPLDRGEMLKYYTLRVNIGPITVLELTHIEGSQRADVVRRALGLLIRTNPRMIEAGAHIRYEFEGESAF